METSRETRKYFFEFDVTEKKTGKICASDDTTMNWNGTSKDLYRLKELLLSSSFGYFSAELHKIKITSAIHLFGEE